MASPTHTLAPKGGLPYSKTSYVIRPKKEFCKPGTEPSEAEALLVKTGTNWKSFEIRTPTEVYNDFETYLSVHAVSPFEGKWWDPWMFIEVLVKTLELYNSNWISGLAFKEESAPIEPSSYIPTPPPAPSPENVALYLATFQIRHNKKREPCEPSKPLTATMTFSEENDHYIKQGRAELHYHSVHKWHNGSFATEEAIAKDREKNGTPWGHIHVLVNGEWIPGVDFIAMREGAQ
jgi:hypothetical protein